MKKWTLIKRGGDPEFMIDLRSRRLAGMLADVWQSIPESDRNQINNEMVLLTDASNVRRLLDGIAPLGGIYGGACGDGIHVRRFVYLDAGKLARKPAAFVRYVIAHELGHIYNRSDNEKNADRTAARWGYKRQALQKAGRR